MAPRSRPPYVAIARKFFESDPLWLEGRRFSRAEAWFDLVQRACYVEQDWAIPGGVVIRLARGETPPLSRSYLARRWGWSANKTWRFMRVMERCNRIRAGKETRQGTTYVLVNYAVFQGGQTGSETDDGTGRRRVVDGSQTESESGKQESRRDIPPDPALSPLANQSTPAHEDGKPEPVEALWTVWLEELGGRPPHPRLIDERRRKLGALYREHLSLAADPCEAFRAILRRVKASDHHMSKREYQLPESLFRNEARRDRWASGHVGGQGDGDGRDLPPSIQPANDPVLLGPDEDLGGPP